MDRLCLFDLDGTLTDPKEGIVKSVRYALTSFGIHENEDEKLFRFIGPPLRDSFREFYGFNETEVERAITKYREYYSETGIYECTVYEGIIEMLECLQNKSISMAIATSKPTVYAKQIARHFNFDHYFEFIAGSELDGTRSRKSEVINYVLDKVDPGRQKQAVMIGDRKHDVIGGKECGIETIGVTWGYGSREELDEARAGKIIDSLYELSSI